jgi:hypothetical protein
MQSGTPLQPAVIAQANTTFKHYSLMVMARDNVMEKRDAWIALAKEYHISPSDELGKKAEQAHLDFLKAEKQFNQVRMMRKHSRGTESIGVFND